MRQQHPLTPAGLEVNPQYSLNASHDGHHQAQQYAVPLYPAPQFAAQPYQPAQFAAQPYQPAQFAAQPYQPAQFAAQPCQPAQFAAQPYQAQQYPVSPYQAPAYQAQQYPAAGFGQSPASVAHWILPTGRSWQSITAGYVALIAILAWFLGPVALGLGIWALVKASRDGSHGRGRAIFAVIVGSLSSVLLLLVLATV
jgi:hypothetical protein